MPKYTAAITYVWLESTDLDGYGPWESEEPGTDDLYSRVPLHVRTTVTYRGFDYHRCGHYLVNFWQRYLESYGLHFEVTVAVSKLQRRQSQRAPRRPLAHQSLSPAQIVANAVQKRSASAESSRKCKRKRIAEPIRQQASDHHHSASSE